VLQNLLRKGGAQPERRELLRLLKAVAPGERPTNIRANADANLARHFAGPDPLGSRKLPLQLLDPVEDGFDVRHSGKLALSLCRAFRKAQVGEQFPYAFQNRLASDLTRRKD
jgi:hypothetical protein